MTREEQIYKEAVEYVKYSDNMLKQICGESFTDGARWADSNSNWHKYPDEKPTIRQWYNVYLENGAVVGAYYGTNYMWYDTGMNRKLIDTWNSDVIAWMELPKPPKFD